MILISPYSRPLRNGKNNPKNFPYWREVVDLLKTKNDIVQIGVEGEKKLCQDFRKGLPLDEVKKLGLTLDQYLASTGRNTEQLRAEYQTKAETDIKL